jgi:hypothetical protein
MVGYGKVGSSMQPTFFVGCVEKKQPIETGFFFSLPFFPLCLFYPAVTVPVTDFLSFPPLKESKKERTQEACSF